jgi:hypothetical protein
MALELLQPGIQPIGQYDGYDAITLNTKGGEVATLLAVEIGTDKSAYDASGADGYHGGQYRPAVTTQLVSGARPLFLVDDGLAGYGTLFGSVLGATVGQDVSTGFAGAPGNQFGALLGPHTASGSGKLTLWDKPGTYAVTLDAVDTDAVDGLSVTNTTLRTGDALYATAEGLLTPDAGKAFEAVAIGRFINFETLKGGSLVTTPVHQVSAVNSPVGLSQPQQQVMTRASFYFNPNV